MDFTVIILQPQEICCHILQTKIHIPGDFFEILAISLVNNLSSSSFSGFQLYAFVVRKNALYYFSIFKYEMTSLFANYLMVFLGRCSLEKNMQSDNMQPFGVKGYV